MTKNVNKIVKLGVLSALSLALMLLIRFPLIPAAPFLEYEPADVPIVIAALMYGPVSGLLTTVIVSVIQAVTVSSGGGWVGLVMHIIATGTYAVVAGLIYKRKHTLKGAIVALVAGTLAMSLIIIPSNLFFTVNFYGYPYDTVMAMLPTVFVPFTLIKGTINSVLTLLIYKSLRKIFNKI